MKEFISKRPILVLVLAYILYDFLLMIFPSKLINNSPLFWGFGGFMIFWILNVNFQELIAKKPVSSFLPVLISNLWVSNAIGLSNQHLVILLMLLMISWFLNLVIKQFVKKNTPILALIITILIYHYLYTPMIASSCHDISVKAAVQQYKGYHPEDKEGTYLTKNYEHYYLQCLRESGIHKL